MMTRSPEQIEAVANRNAEFLAQLRLQAIEALISGDWDAFYQFLNIARGVTNPPRLQRVSLQDFLEKHSCSTQTTITVEVDDEEAGTSEPTRSA